MTELIHGGDVVGYREAYGREPLDFSANINPFGLPESARQAVIDSLAEADRYPDPLCRKLCRAIAEKEGVPAGYVLCGNGAADLIFRLAAVKAPARPAGGAAPAGEGANAAALVLAPTFAEYELALGGAGWRVTRHPLSPENDFCLTEAILRELTPEIGLLALCNPNNPTGQLIEPELLERIVRRCRQLGIRVLLDECFLDFVEEGGKMTLAGRLAEFPNLLILKAFTKSYAMAGIRLGYLLCADSDLLEKLRLAGQPWGVSSLAQAAGAAALGEEEYLERSRRAIAAENKRLRQAMRELGLQVIGSRANYLFFRGGPLDLAKRLKAGGVLIRSCDNYPGLAPGYCRAAVRTREENDLLLAALAGALKKQAPGSGRRIFNE